MQGIHRQPHARLDAQYLVALSHDLRAPLTNISQALQLLEAQDADQKRPEYERIWRNLQQINRMIENQLDYSELEANHSAYSFSDINILPWLQETCAELRQEALWHGVELIYYCACDSAWMRCDLVKLERCLLNLFTNALRHTAKDGLITISAESTGRSLFLRVSDTGEGMDGNNAAIAGLAGQTAAHPQARTVPGSPRPISGEVILSWHAGAFLAGKRPRRRDQRGDEV